MSGGTIAREQGGSASPDEILISISSQCSDNKHFLGFEKVKPCTLYFYITCEAKKMS
jgi:hypothetical protein